MLFGAFPFDSTDHDPNSITTVHDILEQQLASLAKEQKWKLPGVDLDVLSSGCQDLLRRIFTIDPAKRISIGDIQQHPWYVPPFCHATPFVLCMKLIQQKGGQRRAQRMSK